MATIDDSAYEIAASLITGVRFVIRPPARPPIAAISDKRRCAFDKYDLSAIFPQLRCGGIVYFFGGKINFRPSITAALR
jgi:hypothetical protein